MTRFRILKQALCLCVCFTSALLAAACKEEGDKSPATTSRTQESRDVVAEDKLTIPEFYGVYAIQDGKTIEIAPAKPIPDLSPNVEFLIYDKSVAGGRSDLKIYRIPMTSEAELANAGKVPADPKTIVESRSKGVANQPEIIRVIPTNSLEPGMYQLEDRVRFYVNKDQLRTGPIIGTWILGDTVLTFGADGTYEMVIDEHHANEHLKESGTWVLEGTRLTTTSESSNDGRPPGTVDVVEITELNDRVLSFREPHEQKGFTFSRMTREMLEFQRMMRELDSRRPTTAPRN